MGNAIINMATKEMVYFANWLTKPLYCGILSEGSLLAKSNWEKRLMVYFAEKNQKLVGLGIVGINLSELEWNKSTFNEQKAFLKDIVNSSMKNKSYNKYHFKLDDKLAHQKLNEIFKLIEKLKIEDISDSKFRYFFEPPDLIDKICSKHKTYLNYFDVPPVDKCLICSIENSN